MPLTSVCVHFSSRIRCSKRPRSLTMMLSPFCPPRVSLVRGVSRKKIFHVPRLNGQKHRDRLIEHFTSNQSFSDDRVGIGSKGQRQSWLPEADLSNLRLHSA